ncbi:hypothetical protein Lesp02_24980 [Lentzea sp. NBRC 105346]|nr:hypothetical protein Lesp02_24980 [Lentzea sp. NBRC 105346]
MLAAMVVTKIDAVATTSEGVRYRDAITAAPHAGTVSSHTRASVGPPPVNRSSSTASRTASPAAIGHCWPLNLSRILSTTDKVGPGEHPGIRPEV